MFHFDLDQYEAADAFGRADRPKPAWHGRKAASASYPDWWGVPRDHANGIQVSHADAGLWAWIGTIVLVALAGVSAFMLAMVLR